MSCFFVVLVMLMAIVPAGYADPPDWDLDPAAFQYTCNITGILYVNNEPAFDPFNELAAFVDGEIRGVASPVQVGNMWLFFLTVYSNEVVGEMIHFQ
ncbi:MAG: hypothetical protein D6675_12370, partial [Gemmatimonadetes bacterium]